MRREYYAIVRTDDYLAHYGIKGMKWGVRRALEKGEDRALRRQYKKARRKLKELQRESDWIGHEVRARAWEKVDKVPVLGLLTGAKVRAAVHNYKTSTYGDLMTDRKYDKFEDAMRKTFKGTKYDIGKMERLEKAAKTRRKNKIRKRLGLTTSK